MKMVIEVASKLRIFNYKYLRNNLNDQNILTIDLNKNYELTTEEKGKLNLNRPINIDGIDTIFKDATDPEKVIVFLKIDKQEFNISKAAYTDAFIGLNLHNLLRLSLSEASRPELWCSLIISNISALNYLKYRINLENKRELKSKDVFIGQSISDVHKGNLISSRWWIVELTRNGKNYKSALDAFSCTTYFTDRISQYNIFHKRPLAIGMSTYFANFDSPQRFENKTKRNVLAVPDDDKGIIQTSIIDYLLVKRIIPGVQNPNIDIKKFEIWQQKKNTFKFDGGPDDFNVNETDLKKVYDLIDTIGVLRGWNKLI